MLEIYTIVRLIHMTVVLVLLYNAALALKYTYIQYIVVQSSDSLHG